MGGLFVSQVEMLMVLSWQVVGVMMELWEPYAKQNIVTLYTEQPSNVSHFNYMSGVVRERLESCGFKNINNN